MGELVICVRRSVTGDSMPSSPWAWPGCDDCGHLLVMPPILHKEGALGCLACGELWVCPSLPSRAEWAWLPNLPKSSGQCRAAGGRDSAELPPAPAPPQGLSGTSSPSPGPFTAVLGIWGGVYQPISSPAREIPEAGPMPPPLLTLALKPSSPTAVTRVPSSF